MPFSSKRVTTVFARALARRVVESMDRLQQIQATGVPMDRVLQIAQLIEQSQVYVVFLEEIASSSQEASRQGVSAMVTNINSHCTFVDKAWKTLRGAGTTTG